MKTTSLKRLKQPYPKNKEDLTQDVKTFSPKKCFLLSKHLFYLFNLQIVHIMLMFIYWWTVKIKMWNYCINVERIFVTAPIYPAFCFCHSKEVLNLWKLVSLTFTLHYSHPSIIWLLVSISYRWHWISLSQELVWPWEPCHQTGVLW